MTDVAGESIGTARVDVVVNTAQFDAAITSAKRRTVDMSQAAQDAYAKLNASEKRRVDSLIKQADTLGYTRQQQILYNAAIKGVPTDILDALKVKLSGAAGAQEALNAAQGGGAKSAKEINFALRGLPAQITDIFTSLQGGQRPLTVLLQQGGQLKDMFGGVVPAAKALGGQLLRLVNPYTLAAGAAAALLLAWKEGSDEADAYTKALITTGNYAGMTSAQLQTLAADMGGVQHANAAIVASVVSSGKFTGEQIALVARGAKDMQRISGQATDATIQQYEKLAGDPVKAVLALNESQHFLTVSTYEQIKALQDQGREQEASTLAMRTYTSELGKRRAEVVENAGLMERAWAGITGEAKKAWDAMLDVGREAVGDDKLLQLQATANAAATAYLNLKNNAALQSEYEHTRPGMSADMLADLKARSDAATAAYHAEEHAQELARQGASKQAALARLTQDKADSDAEVMEFATNRQKRDAAILKAKGEYDDRIARAMAAGDSALADKLRASEKLVLAGISQKFKDPKTAKKPADPFNTLNGLVQKAQVQDNNFGIHDQQTQQVTDILAIVDAGAKLIASGHDVARVQAEVATGVTALNALYGKQADQLHAKNVAAIDSYRAAMEKTNAALQLQVNNEIARIGMGQKEFQQQQQINKAYQEQADKLEQVAIKQKEYASTSGKSGLSAQDATDMTSVIQQETDKRVEIIRRGFQDQAAAQLDWKNGAIAAYQDFIDSASNAAGQTRDLTTNTLNGLADGIGNAMTGAKFKVKDFVKSALADFTKMEFRIAASKILMSLFGGGSTTSGDFSNSDALAGDTIGGGYSGYGMMVSGGRAAGGPVSPGSLYEVAEQGRPELLRTNGHTYLMTGSQGGQVTPAGTASTAGMHGGGVGDLEVQINITNKGQPVQAQESGRRMDGKKMMIDLILDTVSGDTAKGGRTAQATAQRFGLQRRGVPVGG